MKYHKKEKTTINYLISIKLKLNNINKIDIKDKNA